MNDIGPSRVTETRGSNSIQIVEAATSNDFAIARGLIEEYVATLGVDLEFQNFENEIRDLRGCYGAPDGCLLVGSFNGALAGCVAFRRRDSTSCEMKRLYVRNPFRKTGLGRVLVGSLIERARDSGYSRMVLDTMPDMLAARQLYAALGFQEIGGYYHNPVPGVRYMALELTAGNATTPGCS